MHGEPVRGVMFPALMHLAVAFITCNALVHVAPAGTADGMQAEGSISPSR
jgi:hypothetical protein